MFLFYVASLRLKNVTKHILKLYDNWGKPVKTNSYPAVSVSHGKFHERDTCQPLEKQRDLMRRRTSWRDTACLPGTHTGNRLGKWLVCVCTCECVCGQATPSGVCHHGNCLHENNTTCRSGLPDNGGQMGSKGWRTEPNTDLSKGIKSNSVGIPDAKSLWFYCLSLFVWVIQYMAICLVSRSLFLCVSHSLIHIL